jgi:hypothetical protein
MPIDNNITNNQEQNSTTNQQAENQNSNIQGDNTVKILMSGLREMSL